MSTAVDPNHHANQVSQQAQAQAQSAQDKPGSSEAQHHEDAKSTKHSSQDTFDREQEATERRRRKAQEEERTTVNQTQQPQQPHNQPSFQVSEVIKNDARKC